VSEHGTRLRVDSPRCSELDLAPLRQSRYLDDVGCAECFRLSRSVEDVTCIENVLGVEPNAKVLRGTILSQRSSAGASHSRTG
jgi:hypothetical protein